MGEDTGVSSYVQMPISPPAKPGDWDHITWVSCLGNHHWGPCHQTALHTNTSNMIVREVLILLRSSMERPASPLRDSSSRRPSHFFIPIACSLRNLNQGNNCLLPFLYIKRIIQTCTPVYPLLGSIVRQWRPGCWSLWLKSVGLFMSWEITMCFYAWLEQRLKLTAGSQKLWVTGSLLSLLPAGPVCFPACRIRRMAITFIWCLLSNGPKGLFWPDENSVEAGLMWKEGGHLTNESTRAQEGNYILSSSWHSHTGYWWLLQNLLPAERSGRPWKGWDKALWAWGRLCGVVVGVTSTAGSQQ